MPVLNVIFVNCKLCKVLLSEVDVVVFSPSFSVAATSSNNPHITNPPIGVPAANPALVDAFGSKISEAGTIPAIGLNTSVVTSIEV